MSVEHELRISFSESRTSISPTQHECAPCAASRSVNAEHRYSKCGMSVRRRFASRSENAKPRFASLE
jgi:hypothetical protein